MAWLHALLFWASCATCAAFASDPPTAYCPASATGTTLPGQDVGTVTFDKAPIAITESNMVLSDYNCTVELEGNLTASFVENIDPYMFGVGVNTVVCSLTEPTYGLTDSCTFTVTIVDNESPELTCITMGFQVNLGLPGPNVTVDVRDLVNVTDNVDNDIEAMCTSSGNFTDPDNVYGIVDFRVGARNITCSATDSAGNNADMCVFELTVLDDIRPEIMDCPSSFVNQTDSRSFRGSANWVPPTATDNSGEVTLTLKFLQPNVKRSIGTKNIRYIAVDSSGNERKCRFTFTIEDVEPPAVMDCPDNVTVSATGIMTTVMFTPPTFNDVLDGRRGVTYETVESSHVPGDDFPLGTTVVEYNATDLSGNVAKCIFDVIVVDDEPPDTTQVAFCYSIVYDTDPGNATRLYTFTAPPFEDNVEIAFTNASLTSPALFDVGTNIIYFTATDTSGNVGTCMRTVEIEDNESPRIVGCPTDITQPADPGQSKAVVTWPQPTFMDNVGIVSNTSTYNSGDEFFVLNSNTTVTIEIADASGFTDTCSFIVTITDVESPVVASCVPDIVEGTLPRSVNGTASWRRPIFNDVVDGFVPSTSNYNSGDMFAIGTFGVVYTATDEAGNSANCSFTVTIEDMEGPYSDNCVDIVVTSSTDMTLVNYTEPDFADNVMVVNVTSSHPPPAMFELGMTTVTYTAFDDSGNIGQCTFTVSVGGPPRIWCPPAVTSATLPGQNYSMVTLTPDEAIGQSIANDNFLDTNCSVENDGRVARMAVIGTHPYMYGTNTITCSTTNEQAPRVSSSCTFTVTITDTESPVLSCPMEINSTLAMSSSMGVDFMLDVTDNVDDDVQIVCTSDFMGDASDLFESQGFNLTMGVRNVTCTATDDDGNEDKCSFIITVTDVTDPELIGCPSSFVNQTDSRSIKGSGDWVPPTATDNSGNFTVSSNLDPDEKLPIGDHNVTYFAVDPSGNMVRCSFTVTIEDVEPPAVMDCPDNVTVNAAGIMTSVMFTPPTFNDVLDGTHGVTYETVESSHKPGNDFPLGTTVVEYNATDLSGNVAKCIFDVIVVDDVPPDVMSRAMECGTTTLSTDPGNATHLYTFMEPTWLDNIQLASTKSSMMSPALLDVGTTNITFTATDTAGNVGVCVRTVFVEDLESPQFLYCPTDITQPTDLGLGTSVVTWTQATFSDNVGVVKNATSHNSGDPFPFASSPTTVEISIVDAAGLGELCTFTVTITDEESPMVVDCPADIVNGTFSRSVMGTATWTEPVFTDAADSMVSSTSNYNPGDMFGIGTYEVFYNASDSSGNYANCSFSVTIEDTDEPYSDNCVDIVVTSTLDMTLVNYTEPDFADNVMVVNVTSSHPPPAMFELGMTTVTYTATDDSGNIGQCSFTVSVGGPPLIWCPPAVTSATLPGQNYSMVTLTPDEAIGQSIANDNFLDTNCSVENDGRVARMAVIGTHPYMYGTNTITCSATNEQAPRLSSSCTFTVTITDTESPVLSCPMEINSTLAMSSSMGVDFMLDVTDNVDDDVQIVCTSDFMGDASDLLESQGFNLTMGVRNVTCTATDDDGNEAKCSFIITVTDEIRPVLTNCPMDILQETDYGQATAVVDWTPPSVSDNSGLFTLNSTADPKDMFDVGTVTVTYTAYDAAGGEASCAFNVTVVDLEAPRDDMCSSRSETVSAVSVLTIVSPNTPMFVDNVDGALMMATSSLGRPGPYDLPLGTTNITYTAEDAAGNVGECIVNITVIDDAPPDVKNRAIVCSIVRVNTDPGNATHLYSFVQPTWDDNVANANFNSSMTSPALLDVGNNTIFFTATDTSGNVGECIRTVIVEDIEEPVITDCPANITQPTDPRRNRAVVSWTKPTFSDNVGVVSSDSTHESGELFMYSSDGVPTFVQYTVKDAAGNEATCSFFVTIIDDEPPWLFCPVLVERFNDFRRPYGRLSYDYSSGDNIAITRRTETIPSLLPYNYPIGVTYLNIFVYDEAMNSANCTAEFVITDNEDPRFIGCQSSYMNNNLPGSDMGTVVFPLILPLDNHVVAYTNISTRPGQLFPIGDTEIVFVARDNSSNEAYCIFTVTIVDEEPPEIANCPSDIYINVSLGARTAFVNWTMPTATDNSGEPVSLTSDAMLDGIYPIGETDITYVAIDVYSNIRLCEFNVFVADVEPPAITCPANFEDFADRGTNLTVEWTMPVTSDNSGAPVTVEMTYESGTNFTVGTEVVTATATDESGNEAVCTFSVIIYPTDTEVPVIICPMDVIQESDPGLSTTNVYWPAPRYMDNEEIVTFNLSIANGSLFYIGSETVEYYIEDRVGNSANCSFEVTVIDTEDPVLENCPDDVFVADGMSRVVNWAEVSYTDNSGVPVNLSSNYDSGTEFPFGETFVFFTAVDESGNEATCNFTVFVEDAVAPVITNCPNSTLIFLEALDEANSSYSWTDPTISDNSGDFVVEQTWFSGDVFPVGTTDVVINATDAAGNSTICSFTVDIEDVFPPVLIGCPSNISVSTDYNSATANVSWPTVVAVDNLEIHGLSSTVESGSLFSVGVSEVVYTTFDATYLQTTCSFLVNVTDDEQPMFEVCPENIILSNDPGSDSAVYDWTVPDVTDNVNLTSVTASHEPNSTFPFGTETVLYVATDEAGNEATCEFLVTVNDDEKPVFSYCPDDATAETKGTDMAPVSWTLPVVTDNSGEEVTPLSANMPGQMFPIGTTEVSYVAVDPSENVEQCKFDVIVFDNEPPVFTNCPMDLEVIVENLDDNSTYVNWTTPVATDNSMSVMVTPMEELQGEFILGQTLVEYDAMDPSGNVANCSFVVNVLSFRLKELDIVCPPDVSFSADPGSSNTTVFWSSPSYNGTTMETITSSRTNNSQLEVGMWTVVYVITAMDGRNASCDFTVTVTDDESPVFIDCPSSQSQSLPMGMATATMAWVPPTTSDNVGVLNVTSTRNVNDEFEIGTWTVAYTAVDTAGNMATCSFNITILDEEDPFFTFCPPDVKVYTNADGAVDMPMWSSPNATDNSNQVTVSTTYQGEMFTLAVANYTITYVATDNSGNTAICEFDVSIIDGTSPEISNCPMNVTAPTSPGVSTGQANWTEPTATDNGQLSSLTPDVAPLSTFQLGLTKVTYTAVDSVGLTAECRFYVTVIDTENPQVTCPTSVAASTTPGLGTASVSWPMASATDNVAVTSLTSDYQPNDVFPIGSHVVTYTASDAAGNGDNCTFNVVVSDNEDPVFTFCPMSMELLTGEGGMLVIPPLVMPNATDNAGSPVITNDYNVSSVVLGTTTAVTFTATDGSGNQATCSLNINVTDGTPPVISNCPEDVSIPTSPGASTGQADWTEPTATDNGQLSSLTPDVAPLSTFQLGLTVVTYTAVDSVGLTAECRFSVTVTDKEAPVFTLCPGTVATANTPSLATGSAFWVAPMVTDNVGVVNVTSNHEPLGTFPIGSTEVVYVAVDEAGNKANCTFTAIIQDNEMPVFTFCPGNVTALTGAFNGTHAMASWDMPNATDNAGPPTVTSDYSGQAFEIGTETVITYTASDGVNQATCSFTVTVVDGTPPSITGCPSTVTIGNDPTLATAVYNWTAPMASDNVGVVSFVSDRNSGEAFGFGTTEVTYLATDGQGLTAECRFNITIEDVEAPTLSNCPSIRTVSGTLTGQAVGQVFWPSPTASDNSLVTPSLESNFEPNDLFPVDTTIVTYVATDESGNSANCSFEVLVMDFEIPVFTTCPDDVTLYIENPGETSVIPSWETPVATDNAGTPNVTTDYDGEAFQVNTTTLVTYTAVDASGNPATCDFSVTIADSVLPKITICPSNLNVSTSPGLATGVADWTVPTASDDGTVVSFTASHVPPVTLPVGSVVVNYTAVDDQGLVGVCQFTVTVEDTEDPSLIDCPTTTAMNLPEGAAVASPFWIAPTATDNVGVVSISGTSDPLDPMPAGASVVTYTAYDAAGNTDTCSFNVIILDSEPPFFTFCPSSLEFPTSSNGSYAIPSWPAPNATDIAGETTVTSDYDDTPLPLGSTTLITYTATDESFNEDTCSFNVTITDGTPPVISGCPDSLNVSADVDLSTGQASWPTPTADDNLMLASLTSTHNTSYVFPMGSTEVTYTATDSVGLTATCSFTVTVGGLNTCISMPCQNGGECVREGTVDVCSCPAAWTGDNCTEDVNECLNAPCAADRDCINTVGNYTCTCRPGFSLVGDNCRDVNECIDSSACAVDQICINTYGSYICRCKRGFFLVGDTCLVDLPPTFTGCPMNQTVPADPGLYNANVTWVEPSAVDQATPMPSVSTNSNPGDVFPVGSTTVTYTAVDDADQTATCSFVITVEDREDPTIVDCPLRVDAVVPVSSSTVSVTWTEPSVSDNSGSADLTPSLPLGSNLGIGETVVTYTAIDASGNMDTCNFTVYVTGDAPPTFTSCPDNVVTTTLTGQGYANPTWAAPTAEDDASTPTIVEANGYSPGDVISIGQVLITYTAMDSAGQTAICQFNVTVLDQEQPEIMTCPSDMEEITFNNAPVAVLWLLPTATDNSDEFMSEVNDGHIPGESFDVGTTSIIYTFTDPSGNEATCMFDITVTNDAPPQFNSCPPNTTVSSEPGQSYATVSFAFPNPTDDLSNPKLAGSHAPGTQFPIGSTTVVFTAYDSSGQVATCAFVITVEDRGDPVILNCPEDIIVRVTQTTTSTQVYWTPPTANDTTSVTLTSDKNPGDVFTTGSRTKVTYTATDAGGNSVECEFFVQVEGVLPTYETDGSVVLTEYLTVSGPFTTLITRSQQDQLQSDLERLFRISPISDEFLGLTLKTSSYTVGSYIYTFTFDLAVAGTPPPNDTSITSAFYAALTGPENKSFEDGNKVQLGSFMLSLQTCVNIPCKNEGTCVQEGSVNVCSCPAAWTGDFCTEDVNECLNTPCAADRDCINTVGSYFCGCREGFFLVGDTCLPTSQFSGRFAVTRIGDSEAIFTPDLSDPSSAAFLRMSGDVTSVLDRIFADEPTYLASRVLSMTEGSIVVDYLLIFEEDTALTEDTVTSQMSSSVSADGAIGDSVLYIRPSSLTIATKICPYGYCKNGGSCSPDPVTYESSCTCVDPYSGERCEVMDIWSPLVIAMVSVAGVLLLVLIGLFVACCLFLRTHLNEDNEPKFPGIYATEQAREPVVKVSRPVSQRRRHQSAVEPPFNPHGRSVSTSFADHARHVDASAGRYLPTEDYTLNAVHRGFENQGYEGAYLNGPRPSTLNHDLAYQLREVAMMEDDDRFMEMMSREGDMPAPDYEDHDDDDDEVFPVYDPFPQVEHTMDDLSLQRVGYANDMVPDYPQSTTFVRPYVATGQEALDNFQRNNGQGRTMEADYF